MNRWLVGTCVAMLFLMAVHYRVFVIDITSLHNSAWTLLEWFARTLGEALILLYLSNGQKGNSI